MLKLWSGKLTFLFMSSPLRTHLRKLFWIERTRKARETRVFWTRIFFGMYKMINLAVFMLLD